MNDAAAAPAQTEHASAVALEIGGAWRGALILGPAGSGKSALALELMAMGARLVADDRVRLARQGRAVLAMAPPSIAGLIEARGIGLLQAEPVAHAPVELVVDLGQIEAHRLPPARRIDLLGVSIPLVHKVENACFAAAMLQLLKGGIRYPETPIPVR